MNNEFSGTHIIVTKNGGFYAVENLNPTPQWISATSDNMELTFHLSEITAILKPKTAKEIPRTHQINEIIAGILWVENKIQQFTKIFPTQAEKVEIIIFGSTGQATHCTLCCVECGS